MNEVVEHTSRDREHERVLGIVFDISPAQASVLSCLCQNPLATADELLKHSGSKSHIKVVVSRTRSKLQAHGFDIKSKMGVGYWITAEDKAGIDAMVQKFINGG